MKKFFIYFLVLFALGSVHAQSKDFVTTGSGVRVKKIAFIEVKVYSIIHQMKEPLPTKSASEVIAADVDKRFTLKMLRDVDSEKIVAAINEAFDKNGYTDKANKDKFSSVLTGDLKEGSSITISYTASSKTVTCSYSGKTSTVTADGFMKAVWSIWFGKIDQPSLTSSLMSNLK